MLKGYSIAFVKTTLCSQSFWPSSNWRSNYAKALLLTTMEVIDAKDPIIVPSCGLKNLKPSLIETKIYTPFRDFNIQDFVFMRPYDPEACSYVDGKSIK
jgi:hypothetical protein